jgi:hypothetical protein
MSAMSQLAKQPRPQGAAGRAAEDASNPLSAFYDIFLPASVRTQLNKAATLTLSYNPSLSSSTSLSNLNVWYFNTATSQYVLEDLNKQINTLNNTISVDVNHFSVFVVLGSTPVVTSTNPFTGATLEAHNFPNPFNLDSKTKTINAAAGSGSFAAGSNVTFRGTMIRVAVPADAPESTGEIRIFNVVGQLVKEIDMQGLSPSSYEYFEWDGTNGAGRDVASGVYIGEVKIGSQKFMWKMALIKNARYQ